eukprot:6178628-Pyramimonas_sp.AAC.1
MGKRYRLFLLANAAEKEKFDKMSQNEKLEERAKWIAKQWDVYEMQRQKITETIQSDSVEGEMMNLDQLIVSEGGHQSDRAVEGALNIARWCVGRGYPFVKYNRRSKRLMFKQIKEKELKAKNKRWRDIETQDTADSGRSKRACLPMAPGAQPSSGSASLGAISKATGPPPAVLETPTKNEQPVVPKPPSSSPGKAGVLKPPPPGNAVAGKAVTKGKGGKAGKVAKAKMATAKAQAKAREASGLHLVGAYSQLCKQVERITKQAEVPESSWNKMKPLMGTLITKHEQLEQARAEREDGAGGGGGRRRVRGRARRMEMLE